MLYRAESDGLQWVMFLKVYDRWLGFRCIWRESAPTARVTWNSLESQPLRKPNNTVLAILDDLSACLVSNVYLGIAEGNVGCDLTEAVFVCYCFWVGVSKK